MKVFIDTNILVSAVIAIDSMPQKAFNLASSLPNQGVISYQVLYEPQGINLNNIYSYFYLHPLFLHIFVDKIICLGFQPRHKF